jgi:hypothetical protein
VVYEVDTWLWLTDVAARLGRPVSLGDVPGQEWDEVVPAGVDAVWLMGVWERSPAGLAVARRDDKLQAAFRQALPDLRAEDVVGSPYCVRRYVVDRRLGGPEGLAAARAALSRRGVRLVLDYVPNHVAPDHPWVREHPEYFVRGSRQDHDAAPDAWFDLDGQVLAHGRDPYFPPWPDVVQLDAFSADLREATADVLVSIGEQCDGVRCDMAMLLVNDVFAKTWGSVVGAAPADEFWPSVLERVRRRFPDLLLVAEAYWDMEWQLQQQGFDLCYDKRLYDRLVSGDAGAVRQHLQADLDYQRHLVRFTENHDEPRAAATFPPGADLAAAVAVATLPGATLWHDGQFERRRVHVPVFLGRRPAEAPDADALEAHRRLVAVVADSGMRQGSWRPAERCGWPDNPTAGDLLAWTWTSPSARHLVVVNLAPHASQARVELPWPELAGADHELRDLLSGADFRRSGDELAADGLFVDLPPWGSHVLAVDPAG